jgi:hypothetical protein
MRLAEERRQHGNGEQEQEPRQLHQEDARERGERHEVLC